MPTPTLQTLRLLLRPFDRADAADVFAYASNPNVARFTTWNPHRTISDSHVFCPGRPRQGLGAFSHITTVVSCALAENTASQRVMENCGLKFDHTQFYRWSKCTEFVKQRYYQMVRGDGAAG